MKINGIYYTEVDSMVPHFIKYIGKWVKTLGEKGEKERINGFDYFYMILYKKVKYINLNKVAGLQYALLLLKIY